MPIGEPVVLQRDGKRLFAMRHRPSGAARAAFLLCHPFAEEKKNSHRCFVEIARALSDGGCGVLRFDHFGCGDSGGDFGESTLATRRADIAAALDVLADDFPDADLGLLGLRLGATLAAEAADDRRVRHLALIEPILDGRRGFATDLRRMLIKQMMTDGEAAVDRKEVMARLERGEGSLDFDGYTVSATLYNELTALTFDAVPRRALRLLTIQVSPRGTVGDALQAVADSYADAGADVTTRAVAVPPPWNRLDTVDSRPFIDALLDWFDSTGGGA